MADFWILGGVTLYRRNARNKRIKIKLNTSNDTLRLDYNLSNMKNNSFYKIGFWFLLGVLILFGFLFANGALDGKFLISNPFKMVVSMEVGLTRMERDLKIPTVVIPAPV